jgi:transcriptional regulator of acetoin/glycerol metabolism
MNGDVFALNVRANLGVEGSRLERAWKSFVVLKHDDPGVRPFVLESWNRCAHTGLDAFTSKSPRAVSDAQVRDYVENDPIFAEIKLVLPSLNTAAFDSGHMLVCCDPAGHIMHLAGEASVRRRADRMNFVVGSHWGEDQAGTNAIGTAIVTGSPVQLFGSEHYCAAVHPWTCSAAPIRDPATNNVLAVIDMTGLREAFHPHTLVSVIAMTQLVEERLRGKLDADRYRLLELYADRTTRSPQMPIAVLDRGGRVVKASPVLHRHGWINSQGYLAGCAMASLTGETDWAWEADGTAGRWSFVLTRYLDRGRLIGAIVHVAKDASLINHSRPAASVPAGGCDLHTFDSLIGETDSFRSALAVARSSAASDLPVLIEGETGTGKELIAQAIHFASARTAKPFVAVNCGALPRELATSEFFGYEGGSFTGAAREGRIGKFEQANGGTLFLDEIGDMPLELQALLLRVLDDQKVVHVGGRKSICVNVRLIAATNQDLLLATERGAFRRDLYYRLRVIKVHMPPLRQRQEDLALLLDYYCEKVFRGAGRVVPLIEPDALRLLQHHSWPGNVRELRNLVEWLAVNTIGHIVRKQDLPPEFHRTQSRLESSGDRHIPGPLKAQELETIQSVLEECTGNVTEAARRLGINRSTIYRKLGKSPSSK